jgi:hypothetical protein
MQTLSRATVQLIATVAIALVSAAAMASEATQFELEPSIQTRADVKAELASSPKEATMIQIGDATVFVDAAGSRSRAEVRAEAVQAARDHHVNLLYVGA